MSPRSLFNVILKVLGLLFVKEFLFAVPTLFAYFIYVGAASYSGYGSFALFALSILFYGWLAWLLLIRTNWVIDLFRLDKNFQEENLSINVHRSSVLMIAVIVIGGLIVVDAIPAVCRQLDNYWERKSISSEIENSSVSVVEVVVPAIKLITGLLLLGYTRSIVNFIELKRRNH